MGLIILTGPKHAGKTTAGRALADRCAGNFTDLDEMVQAHTGKSPRTLFKEGAEVFRMAEAGALRSLLNTKAAGDAPGRLHIVAAGGGLVDNGAALDLLKMSDTVMLVYLDVSVETAWERIRITAEHTGELPPFLNTTDPQETHRLLHERRAAAYRKIAHIIIKADGKDPETIAEELFSKTMHCSNAVR
ncbi:shikimate kinase [Spirochaetia bacterium]|nr:shikimate kinase [Spirochaetia bacterium]